LLARQSGFRRRVQRPEVVVRLAALVAVAGGSDHLVVLRLAEVPAQERSGPVVGWNRRRELPERSLGRPRVGLPLDQVQLEARERIVRTPQQFCRACAPVGLLQRAGAGDQAQGPGARNGSLQLLRQVALELLPVESIAIGGAPTI